MVSVAVGNRIERQVTKMTLDEKTTLRKKCFKFCSRGLFWCGPRRRLARSRFWGVFVQVKKTTTTSLRSRARARRKRPKAKLVPTQKLQLEFTLCWGTLNSVWPDWAIFCKFPGINYLTKVAKIFWAGLGCFENITLFLKTTVATFCTTFGENWATF